MEDRGSIDIDDLSLEVADAAPVCLRLAIVREADEWQLRRGEIILGSPTAGEERLWALPHDAFIEQEVPVTVAAGLLVGRPQEVAK